MCMLTGNYFGLEVIEDHILKSGTEYLNAFLNSSDCCTLYIKNTNSNTLEANDKIVSNFGILFKFSTVLV